MNGNGMIQSGMRWLMLDLCTYLHSSMCVPVYGGDNRPK